MKGNLSRVGNPLREKDVLTRGGNRSIMDDYVSQTSDFSYNSVSDNYYDFPFHNGRPGPLTYDVGQPSTGTSPQDRDGMPPLVSGFYNSWQAFRGRAFDSRAYENQSASDTDAPYDVREIFFTLPNTATRDFRLHFAHKVVSSTNFYNDLPIGAFQILDINGNVTHDIPCDSSFAGLQTRTSNSSTLTLPSALGSSGWSSITTSVSTVRFGYATSTGSSYTGANNGIDCSNLDSVPMRVGNLSMPQDAASTYYMFRETSGASGYAFGRTTDTLTDLPNIGSIRVAYLATTETGQLSSYEGNDCLHVAFY
jgi:hypothetical protein